MRRSLVLSLILLTACAPQNAAVTSGDFTAWLAATNSITVAKGTALFDAEGTVLVDAEDSRPGSAAGYATSSVIDCREFASATTPAQTEALRLPGREQICDGDADDQWPPEQERWLEQNGFYVVGDQLEPWRGEAIITSEGDVQLAFHHRLPGGEDFRFVIAVDPVFAPRRCAVQDDGSTAWEPIDGDWVDAWSQGLPEGARRWFINGNAYQFSPELPDGAQERQRWFLPLEWRAAYAAGQFGDDAFRVRSTRYAEPYAYIVADQSEVAGFRIPDEAMLFCEYQPPERREFDDDASFEASLASYRAFWDRCVENQVFRAESLAGDVANELALAGIRNADGLPSARPIVHDNVWREPDMVQAGLDGWVELNYSWITFDAGSELEVGGAATGEFNLFMDAIQSQSRFHIRGRFEVESFKKDLWVTEFIPETKAEENGLVLCEPEPTVDEE